VPHVKDALDSFHGAKYFATIDLLSGYWQIGMTKRAKQCSAFCTRRGLFQWTQMLFSLTNAPSTFCRLMENISHDLLYNICICYLDNINVFASTPEQLIDHLDKVFTRLHDHGLKAKLSKCIFFKSSWVIEFLGHLESADEIEPQSDMVEKIENWPVPHCLREVRAFVGLASYYRRFIKHFATLAEPLTSLMQGKSKPFVWTDEAQEAFEKLKQALLDIVTLAYPIPELPCILDTDASDVAVGAVLSQKIDIVEKPIAFYFAVLNRTQRNYCATRREMLAVLKSLQHFRHYLLGAKVILRTDHHSLLWLRIYKNPTSIMVRWIETMAEFDIEIQHRSGRLHSNADALSSHSCKHCYDKKMPSVWIDECERAEEILEPLSVRAICFLSELTSSDVAAMQAEDSDIGPAHAVLSENTDPSPDEIRAFPYESKMLLSHRPQVRLVDDVLVRQTDEQLQLVVPTQLRRRLFDLTHAGPSAAHLGAARTTIQLKTHYYWVGLNRDVRQWCRQCAQCARAKGAPIRPHGHMRNIVAGDPMDFVTMDILSSLSVAADSSKYIPVVCDHFTKWVEAYALPDQEASTCMRAVYDGFFSRFNYPLQIHMDQGRNFESALFKEMCALTGVSKSRTTPFHSRSDGLTERANRTLLQMLHVTCEGNPTGWPTKLSTVL